jgi:hypothetical protein
VGQPFFLLIGNTAGHLDLFEASPGRRRAEEEQIAVADSESGTDDAVGSVDRAPSSIRPEGGILVMVEAVDLAVAAGSPMGAAPMACGI